jgi:hypothetical protein
MAHFTQKINLGPVQAYMGLTAQPNEKKQYYWELCIESERGIPSGCEGLLEIAEGRVVPADGYGKLPYMPNDYVSSVWCGGRKGYDSYRATLRFNPELEGGNKLQWALTIVNEDKGGETSINGSSALN